MSPPRKKVMTAPAVACRDEAFFEEVAETLANWDISGMPVVDASGTVVGVISERDLAHALGGPMVRLAVRRHNHGPFKRDLHDMPRNIRRDVMTTPPVTMVAMARSDERRLRGAKSCGDPRRGELRFARGRIL
ncbi:MAG TPA: CBS domain-containing protein [Actinomycetota bacterium]|nr:CBS domain-containing protein [Actinomycetota bacterium]